MKNRFSRLFAAGVLILLAAFFASAQEEPPQPAVGEVYAIRIRGAVSPGTAGFLTGAVDKAHAAGAQALLVQLDTPGGLADSMRTMVKTIMNAPLPVIVFVSPRGAQAASAGVMVTISADVAAMAPGTNIGAAHPVAAGGKDIEGEMAEKVINDMVAFAQGIAQERGRNASWVKKAVERSVSVTADEAVKLNVVDLKAENRTDLLNRLDGRKIERGGRTFTLRTSGAEVVDIEETMRDRVLRVLADPNIAYILMMLGLAGLYFEISNPGGILPGVVGGISLILAFYSMQTLPVNYAGILLILMGVILFILELKIASYGMLSVGGLISLTLGSLMLFESPYESMRVSLNVIIPVVAVVGGFFILVAALVVRTHRRATPTGTTGMVGEHGVVKTWEGDSGRVLVHGEWWYAKSDDDLASGDEVTVTAADGMKLSVSRRR